MITSLKLIGEKVGWTFVYQFVAVLLTVRSADLYTHQPWMDALISAAWVALITLGTAVATWLTGLQAQLDGFVRVILTGVQSFFGSLIAAGTTDFVHTDWKGALGVAVVAMLPSLLKVLAALANRNTIAASTVRVA